MIRVVVRLYQVLQDVVIHQGVMFGEVLPLFFQSSIESFHDAGFDVVFCSEESDAMVP